MLRYKTDCVMDIYHIWCDLKPGTSDMAFVEAVNNYLGKLRQSGNLENYRITRRKLGLGMKELGEFHLMLEFTGLAQLDNAFTSVAERSDPIEGLHHAVNSLTTSLCFSLYQDFPDEGRTTGNEQF